MMSATIMDSALLNGLSSIHGLPAALVNRINFVSPPFYWIVIKIICSFHGHMTSLII